MTNIYYKDINLFYEFIILEIYIVIYIHHLALRHFEVEAV